MSEQIKFGDRLFLRGETVSFDNGDNDAVIESRNGTLVIRGNLVVEGNTTTISSIETSFSDPILVLNGDHTGPAIDDVGFEVNRGDDPSVSFFWDETNNRWTFVDQDIYTTGNITAGGVAISEITGNVISENGVVIVNYVGDGSVDIRAGNADNLVIGATVPAVGYFTSISGDGANISNVLTNYNTDDLSEGTTNLYFTNERVDDRVNALFNNGYGIKSTYDDSLGSYLLELDAQNIGAGAAILDTANTSVASFRTISAGNITNGGHSDLTVTVSGDELIIDTTTKINQLAFNTFVGNGVISVYTLPYSVSQPWQILVYIDGVVQQPFVSYFVSADTIILSNPLGNAATMSVIRLSSNSASVTVTNADTLGGQYPSYYLDYNNHTNLPTNYMVNDSTNNVNGSINPTVDNTHDLGTPSNQWRAVYGHSITATYADLAERYEADNIYEPGTVVVFGGDKEITTTTTIADRRVAGIISTQPAYLMNSLVGDDETHPPVALKGRVPCKVFGPVTKGQMLITSSYEGYAMATDTPTIGTVIGKAITNKTDLDFGMVEIFVSIM